MPWLKVFLILLLFLLLLLLLQLMILILLMGVSGFQNLNHKYQHSKNLPNGAKGLLLIPLKKNCRFLRVLCVVNAIANNFPLKILASFLRLVVYSLFALCNRCLIHLFPFGLGW